MRYLFGGSRADWTMEPGEPVTAGEVITGYVPVMRPASPVTLWDAREGGEQVTDLVDAITGDPLGSSLVSDNVGSIPPFRGPDNTVVLYASASVDGTAPRYTLAAVDAATGLESLTELVTTIDANLTGVTGRVEALEDRPTLTGVVDVRHLGAAGTGTTDDSAVFQQALDAAAGGGTVYIPAGDYRLESALVIRGHTRVVASVDAHMLRYHTGTMLTNYAPTDSPTGYSGHGHIEVTGGVWDARAHVQAGRGNTIAIAHAEHVRFRDVTVRNTMWAHGIECNSTKDARFEGCVFEGFTIDGDSARVISEAIQIDGAYGSAYLAAPAYDSTPCSDVLIQGCTMRPSAELGPFGAMAGSHSGPAGVQHAGIRVVDCHVEDSLRYKVQVYSWADWSVTGLTGPPAPNGNLVFHPGANNVPGRAAALDDPPRARVRRTTTQAVGNASFTTISFDTARYNTSGLWTGSTDFVAPVPGLYAIGATVEFAANATGSRYLQLVHNLSTAVAHGRQSSDGDATDATRLTASTEIELARGDSVQVRVFQRSGGSLNVLGGAGATEAYMRWIGPPTT